MNVIRCTSFAGVLGLSLVAWGCGGDQKGSTLSYGKSAEAAYRIALEDFNDDDCIEAEPAFREVSRKYPYSRFAALAELRSADCLIKQAKFSEGISAYQEFLRKRPSHPEVSYARFKIAEAHFKQIPDEWLLSPPSHERDQDQTRKSLQQLQRFVVKYPTSPSVKAAQTMIHKALTMLARHELYVAHFYLDRDHPRAAILRLTTLLSAYRGSGVEPEAMLLLGRTYMHLQERDHARQAFTELLTRYPKSGYAAQARSYLAVMGRS